MMRHYPWTDAYTLAVARQLDWVLGSHWTRLQQADKSLKANALQKLLRQLDRTGAPDVIDLVVDWQLPGAQQSLLDDTYKLIARILDAGGKVFTAPDDGYLSIVCDTAYPLTHYSLSMALDFPAQEVVLLSLSDRDWAERRKLPQLTGLRYLAIYDVQQSVSPWDLDIASLPELQALDLSDSLLQRIPEQVRHCDRMEWLSLAFNPLTDVDQLLQCKSLQHVLLKQTAVSAESINTLRERGISVQV